MNDTGGGPLFVRCVPAACDLLVLWAWGYTEGGRGEAWVSGPAGSLGSAEKGLGLLSQ